MSAPSDGPRCAPRPTLEEARRRQVELAERVERVDRLPDPVRRIAGVDVGFELAGQITRAAVVVLDRATLEPVEQRLVRQDTQFPYIPGFLSFRELPAITAALDGLSGQPDLILCDGQGIAHPRRLGIAAHLGVVRDCPTIGVAKSRLIGSHAEVPRTKGAWQPLWDGDEPIGAVLRTRTGVRPLYISLGHRISLERAIEWVLACTTRYRLPETTRCADRLASDRESKGRGRASMRNGPG